MYVAISRTNGWLFSGGAGDLLGFHTRRKGCSMRNAFFFCGAHSAGGGADLARFALLTQVGKLADHQLVSPVDVLIKSHLVG